MASPLRHIGEHVAGAHRASGRVARKVCPTVAGHSRIREMLLAARSAALGEPWRGPSASGPSDPSGVSRPPTVTLDAARSAEAHRLRQCVISDAENAEGDQTRCNDVGVRRLDLQPVVGIVAEDGAVFDRHVEREPVETYSRDSPAEGLGRLERVAFSPWLGAQHYVQDCMQCCRRTLDCAHSPKWSEAHPQSTRGACQPHPVTEISPAPPVYLAEAPVQWGQEAFAFGAALGPVQTFGTRVLYVRS